MFNLSVIVEVLSSNEECVASVHRLNTEQEAKDDMVKNEILSVRTLFPDTTPWDEESDDFKYNFRDHHYLLLVRLEMKDMDQRELRIVQRYENPNGEMITIPSNISLEKPHESEMEEFKEAQSDDGDYYGDNLSIRKAIVVSRYIRLLREWVQSEHGSNGNDNKEEDEVFVSKEFKSNFKQFLVYFQSECAVIDDEELAGDLNVLQHISAAKK